MRILAGVVSSLLALGTLTATAAPAQAAPVTWPGGAAVSAVDASGAFGSNLSGLVYDGSDVWAVKNGPSTLYRLTSAGGTFSAAQTYPLRFPGGLGNPDAEGVTVTSAGASGGVYVAIERDDSDDQTNTSRPGVLRLEPTGTSGTLSATDFWDLTSDLPGLPANKGPEAIAWVPDSYLTASGLQTDQGEAYDPSDHPGHGSGLFLVGVEQTGQVIAYALESTTDTATRVATFASGFGTVMDLNWEPATQRLWVACDDTCGGQTKTFQVSQGAFQETATYERPSGMPDVNNEGFAIAPQDQCANGVKPVLWADDDGTGGHALRQGTITCVLAPDCSAQQAAVTSAQAAVTAAQTAYDAATAKVTALQTQAVVTAQASQVAAGKAEKADAKVAKARKKLKAAKASGKGVAKAKKKLKAAKKAQKAAAAAAVQAGVDAIGTSKALGAAQVAQAGASAALTKAQADLASAKAALSGCQQR